MKKVNVFNALALLLAAIMCFVFNARLSQAGGASFAQVIPFSTVGGFIGFFDQKDGKVYLYDDKLEKCVYQVQMGTLGESGNKVLKDDFNQNTKVK